MTTLELPSSPELIHTYFQGEAMDLSVSAEVLGQLRQDIGATPEQQALPTSVVFLDQKNVNVVKFPYFRKSDLNEVNHFISKNNIEEMNSALIQNEVLAMHRDVKGTAAYEHISETSHMVAARRSLKCLGSAALVLPFMYMDKGRVLMPQDVFPFWSTSIVGIPTLFVHKIAFGVRSAKQWAVITEFAENNAHRYPILSKNN